MNPDALPGPSSSPDRLLPPAYACLAILVMVGLHFVAPVVVLLAFPWNLSGLLPLAVGLAFNMIASRRFEQVDTTIKPFQPSSALVVEGLFLISRNPMYLGGVLILLGVALLLGTLTPFAVIPGFIILLTETFIKVEERMLEARFGEAYRSYKRQVRRWL
jgi:protein-S-isoprenylcysteine O-methyltransferase Ste14